MARMLQIAIAATIGAHLGLCAAEAMDTSKLGPAGPVFDVWVHYSFMGLYVILSLLLIGYLISRNSRLSDASNANYAQLLEQSTKAIVAFTEVGRQTNALLVEVKDCAAAQREATEGVRTYVDTLTQVVLRKGYGGDK